MSPPAVILVVDDNEQNRYVHVRYLEREGFTVIQAETGAEGLRLAPESDLVVLDVRLPDMSGFDVCRRLKQAAGTASIPVLQTSAAFTAVGDRVIGLQEGADAYLCIPVEPQELIATISALLRARRAEIKAQRMSVEWQITFDAISDGICLLDDTLRIVRHNRAFAALISPVSGEPIGRDLTKLLCVDPPEHLATLLRTESGATAELAAGTRWFRVQVDVVCCPDNPGRRVCVFTDVTQVKRIEASLRSAEASLTTYAAQLEVRVRERTRELKARNTELEAFTYSVSHDLRSPLRTIQNFASVLVEECSARLNPIHLDYLIRIQRSAFRMDRLTLDLLAYSQMVRAELTLGRVDLRALLARLVDDRQQSGAAPMPTFEVIEPLPPVWANERALDQALSNLLDNAIKFTRPDVAPVIRISATLSGDHLRIQVADNGTGIEPRYFGKIFMPFERLSAHRGNPGTGIGLAIVQRCVENMGGVIEVTSTPGEGSQFWLTLRTAESKEAEQARS